ncbi:MAG: GNAT family N-acetyltransferase [Deltaproteobacteria bacterium]|nr:GNAT family N-acetyltransferase [Deltaproteobacteria bacterium]
MKSVNAPTTGIVCCDHIPDDSTVWQQIRSLRYELFYRIHGLPESVMDDGLDNNAWHVYATHGDRVIGYGRVTATPDSWWRVTAMVVATEFQRTGVGSRIMMALMDAAISQHARGLTLTARTSAVGFYLRHGFNTEGDIFPSAITGIPHIKMTLNLLNRQSGHL